MVYAPEEDLPLFILSTSHSPFGHVSVQHESMLRFLMTSKHVAFSGQRLLLPWTDEALSDGSWEPSNVVLDEVTDPTALCKMSPTKNVFFVANQVTYDELKTTCEVVGGQIPVPR